MPRNAPSERTKVRRRAGRGRYGREAIDAILDEGLVGHLAFVLDGQPYAMPMLYARSGDEVYVHGSPLSRLIGRAVDGVNLCLTVTLIDGLVLARSAFHHSVNYRSVVLVGEARVVRDREAKLRALDSLVEHIVPGRTADARGPSPQELRATEVVAMTIDEASAKLRTGPPGDAARDYELPVWAGVIPLSMVAGEPVADERNLGDLPEYVRAYTRDGSVHRNGR